MQQSKEMRDAFCEDMGILMEDTGLPRMGGRLLGHLLICEPPHQSAAEIGAALRASKGTVSTMTRMLINMGIVERVGVPQRRESYFRVRPGVWSGLLEVQSDKISMARALAARGISMLEAEGPPADGRLREMHDLYCFLERELPLLLERWKHDYGRRQPVTETFAATSS
jgi:DNA-binding transcriptional regulator GbsR (MarR family)